MKKILIFIIVSIIIICLLFTCEIVMIRKDIDMPNQLRYIFWGGVNADIITDSRLFDRK